MPCVGHRRSKLIANAHSISGKIHESYRLTWSPAVWNGVACWFGDRTVAEFFSAAPSYFNSDSRETNWQKFELTIAYRKENSHQSRWVLFIKRFACARDAVWNDVLMVQLDGDLRIGGDVLLRSWESYKLRPLIAWDRHQKEQKKSNDYDSVWTRIEFRLCLSIAFRKWK